MALLSNNFRQASPTQLSAAVQFITFHNINTLIKHTKIQTFSRIEFYVFRNSSKSTLKCEFTPPHNDTTPNKLTYTQFIITNLIYNCKLQYTIVVHNNDDMIMITVKNSAMFIFFAKSE
jgi:hypothetical protein